MFNLNEYLKDLETIINIESGTGCVAEQTQVAQFFKQKFDELGFITTLHDIGDKTGPMLSCANKKADHYDLMMIGHIDTVFERGMLEKNPFRIDGDKIRGLGVADMKQGSLMMYHIMKCMDKKVLDNLSIIVVFNPDEEIGSIYSMPAYKDIASRTKYCYIYEPERMDGARVIERKGSYGLIAEFFGTEGHSSAIFTKKLKSAINEMVYWITEFNKLHSEEDQTGVNAGVVSGGKAINIVPEYAKLDLGIRLVKKSVVEEVKQTLARCEKHAEEMGIRVNYLKNRFIPPLVPTEEGYAYAKRAEELAKTIDKNFYYVLSGGISDANQIAQFGPITIDGMGPRGTNVHSVDEYMDLNGIENSYKVSKLLIEDLAKNK